MKDMEEKKREGERKRRMPEFCDPDIAFLRAGSQANWAPGEEQHKHRVLVRAGVIYRGHRAPCPLYRLGG